MFKTLIFIIALSPMSLFAEHIFSVGYNLGTQTSGGDTSVRTAINSTTGSVDSDYEKAVSFGYEYRFLSSSRYRYVNSHLGWGFATGFRYHSRVDIEEQEVRGALAGIPAGTMSRASLQTNELYLNAIYSWRVFYIPFGLTYSIYREDTSDSFNGETDARNGFGFNIGLGMHLGHSFGLEFSYTRTKFEISSTQVSPTILGTIQTDNEDYAWKNFNLRLLFKF